MQEDVLGKGAAGVWRGGNVPAGAFIDRNIRGLTLSDLQAKEKAIRKGRRIVVPRMSGEK